MARLPTNEQAKRAFLDAISEYNVRAGEVFPLMGVYMKMQQCGFRAEDIKPALEELIQEGLVEASSSTQFKLTAAGFAAI